MECIRRANEAGSHELRPGWFNDKMDKQGNIVRTYIEDTRKKFVESVKIAKINVSCDFDDEATKNINAIIEELTKIKKDLLESQAKWWDSLTPKYKEMFTAREEDVKSKEFFNSNLLWWQSYIEEEVRCYQNILEEIIKLTSRKDFYAEEEFYA